MVYGRQGGNLEHVNLYLRFVGYLPVSALSRYSCAEPKVPKILLLDERDMLRTGRQDASVEADQSLIGSMAPPYVRWPHGCLLTRICSANDQWALWGSIA